MAQDKNKDNVYRFAPSPSGFLHVGGARTAIFNWLLAQQAGGKFILRIEDTDTRRSTDESVNRILNSLKWLGISWDGKPFFQSGRFSRYREVIDELLDRGKAYRCFCEKTGNNGKRMARYTGKCRMLSDAEVSRNLSVGLPFSIRIRIPDGTTAFRDLVHGKITTNNKELDDFIILRSDGTPVYNLAVTVDDHDMGVTHVIRGDDHIANTPKQIHLYRALSWQVPEYGHLPLILGTDRRRLSKRHGATSVEEFRSKGILPQALFNYLCLLGWSSGDDREIFNRQELISAFSLDRINTANAVFDPEKLLWMNGKYISGMPLKDILAIIKEKSGLPVDTQDEHTNYIGNLIRERARTLNEFGESLVFLYRYPKEYDQDGIQKYFLKGNPGDLLEGLRINLENQVDFSPGGLESSVRTYAELRGVSAAKIIHPLRLALTGKTASPGIFDVMSVLGREKIIQRIKNAILFIESLNGSYKEEHN